MLTDGPKTVVPKTGRPKKGTSLKRNNGHPKNGTTVVPKTGRQSYRKRDTTLSILSQILSQLLNQRACPRKRRGKPTILPTTVKRSKSQNGKQRTRGLDSQSQNSQTTGRLSPNRKNLTLILSVSLKTSRITGTDSLELRQSKRTGRALGETSSAASITPKTGNVVRCSNVHLLTHLLDPVSSSRKNNPNVTTLTGKQ